MRNSAGVMTNQTSISTWNDRLRLARVNVDRAACGLAVSREGEKGITQDELATIIGVARMTVTKWEKGHISLFPLRYSDAICKTLNVTRDWLEVGKLYDGCGPEENPEETLRFISEEVISAELKTIMQTAVKSGALQDLVMAMQHASFNALLQSLPRDEQRLISVYLSCRSKLSSSNLSLLTRALNLTMENFLTMTSD